MITRLSKCIVTQIIITNNVLNLTNFYYEYFFKYLFIICFSINLIHSQVIYSDNFDEGILKFQATSSYTPSLSNNIVTIQGDGSAGAYAAFSYELHNSGTNSNVNIASSPKVFIKAKGTDLPSIRIDLLDSGEFVTNLSAQTVRLSDTFEIYELDYSNSLLDGGYGGPCDPGDAPCPVDASSIKNLVFFVNAAAGAYDGSIEIEWISLGAPYEALPPPSAYDIRYNQVGYLTGREKLININALSGFSNKAYAVYDDQDNLVLSGTTGTASIWNDASEYTAAVDVSAIDTPGEYRFVIDEMEITFNVSNDGYQNIREEVFKYYYYNRASTALTTSYAGAYARNSGHSDTNVIVHQSAASPQRPTGTIISASKGWYDAGDYNKYIVNSGISTYTLLAAYEHYSSYYDATTFSIPEQGGDLPDILDETIWNLDWMLDMQDPNDGGVYHKLTGLGFSGKIMPDAYNLDRYVVQKSTSAALNFAAVTAVASRIFANFESQKPGYSAQLIQAAKDAYDWAKANPTDYYIQPSDVQTGQYDDTTVTDEFQWAAVELFITTGESTYKNDIDISQITEGIPNWQFTAPLPLISIAHHQASLSGDINVAAANAKLLSIATNVKSKVDTSPMRISMSTNDYVWGSNGTTGNQLLMLIRAYELTDDESYLNAAFTGMDYIFGRNGTGYSYVTGFGDNQVIDPHHRISTADNVSMPLPGMIVGGPHATPRTDCTNYPNNFPASSFVDDWCSYSTNEVTINWNAPLVYSMHALHFYQSDFLLDVEDPITNIETNNDISIFPNPASNTLTIKSFNSNTASNLTIFSIEGKKLLSRSITTSNEEVNVSNYSKGFYLVQIDNGKNTVSKMMIKE